jgi:hypothetical protein
MEGSTCHYQRAEFAHDGQLLANRVGELWLVLFLLGIAPWGRWYCR